MSFTSIPVMANDKNKPECVFFFIESFLCRNCYQEKKNDSIFNSYNFNETVCW